MFRNILQLMIIAATFVGGSAFGGEIVLRPQAVPKTSVVRLGDVADIRGVDGNRASQLAKLPLMPAPAAGASRFVRQREIQDMVAAHGEDISQLRFSGAAQVAIRATLDEAAAPANSDASRTPVAGVDSATPADGNSARRGALAEGRAAADSDRDNSLLTKFSEPIRAAMIEHLATQSGCSDGWRVNFSFGERQRASLAAATSPVVCDGGVAPWTGKQRLVISFTTADGPVAMPLLTEVSLTQPVAIAVRPIGRGAVVTAADVEIQQMDNAPAATNRRAPVHVLDELVGMEASRAIQVGEMIYTDLIASPILVKRGESITVVAQGGGIRVTTSARARQDGARGDLVQVESLDTKTRYDARVIGRKEAAVLAPAQNVDRQLLGSTNADRTGDEQREVGAFRRYQTPPVAPSTDVERKTTAFRKLLDQDGKRHVEVR